MGNEDTIKEFVSWVLKNSKYHLTGTNLGQIEEGARLFSKFLDERENDGKS
jgi:hypothetical protein